MSKNRWKQAEPKNVEAPQAAACQEQKAPEISKVDFDAWYAKRSGQIPRHHHKEVIKADFMARGLGQCESLEEFDGALKKYGIKLA